MRKNPHVTRFTQKREERTKEKETENEKERVRDVSQAPRHIRSIYFLDSLLSSCSSASRFLANTKARENKKRIRSSVCECCATTHARAIMQRIVLLDPGMVRYDIVLFCSPVVSDKG